MKPLPMYRKILLSEEINSSSVEKVINSIMSINYDDDMKEADYKDWVREPIYLFINSNGGNAYDAFALGDAIITSKTPVYTVALGWCMSAGFLIYLFGDKRFVGTYSTILYHDVSMWTEGKSESIRQQLGEMHRIGIIFNNLITKSSSITEKDLSEYIKHQSDWYITPEEAIKLKLADGYYESM